MKIALAAAGAVMIILGGVAVSYAAFGNLTADGNGETKAVRVTLEGTLTAIDLAAMATDGPGVFKVKTGTEPAVNVYIDAGESACDREAIRLPNKTAGDTVQVSADRASDGTLQVCTAGTHIK